MLTSKEYWKPGMSAPVHFVYQGRTQIGCLMSSRVGYNTVTNRPIFKWSFLPTSGEELSQRWATRSEALSALETLV